MTMLLVSIVLLLLVLLQLSLSLRVVSTRVTRNDISLSRFITLRLGSSEGSSEGSSAAYKKVIIFI